jgi:hypothetical protein
MVAQVVAEVHQSAFTPVLKVVAQAVNQTV